MVLTDPELTKMEVVLARGLKHNLEKMMQDRALTGQDGPPKYQY